MSKTDILLRMFQTFQRIFLIYSVVAAFVIIRYGYLAATESSSRRKGQARLIASLAFCSWLALAPILWFWYDNTRPVFEFTGKIESVRIVDSSSKHYSAYASIRTLNGRDVQIHFSDSSNFMRPGQNLIVRYRGDSGELIKATFYSSEGKQVGVLQSSRIMSQMGLFLTALFCIWASFRKYRRDPDGAEV